MRIRPLPSLLAASALAAVSVALAANEKHRDLDVVVRSHVTDIGSRQTPADPNLNPLTYRLLTHGYVNYGRPVRGKPPERDALLQHLVAALRHHGWVPAERNRSPRIALLVMWGDIYGDPIGNRDQNPDRIQNATYAREQYLVEDVLPLKWRPDRRFEAPLFTMWQPIERRERERIFDVMEEGTFILSLTAYDWHNASRGVEIPFWQTRAMMPMPGNNSEESFHRAIDTIGPALGKELKLPHLLVAPADKAAASLRFTPTADPDAESADGQPDGIVPVDLDYMIAHDYGHKPLR